jgi:hypothetical protein
VTRRKVSPKQNLTGKGVRFTPDDILRAIAAVEAAGLQVCVVEITFTGSIKINTKPSRHKAKPDASTSASPPNEKAATKKRA